MNRIALTLLFFIVPCLCFIAAGQSPNTIAAPNPDLNNYSLLGIISLVIGGAMKLIHSLTQSLTTELKIAIENNTEALHEIKVQLANLDDRIKNLEKN